MSAGRVTAVVPPPEMTAPRAVAVSAVAKALLTVTVVIVEADTRKVQLLLALVKPEKVMLWPFRPAVGKVPV